MSARNYVEFMFRHDDKTGAFLLRMREHIRSRGYGAWVTVATSPSRSYKEAKIIEFLDRHLPFFDPQLRGCVGNDYVTYASLSRGSLRT